MTKAIGRVVYVSALVGALVPVFWGVLGFINFTRPNGQWADTFWRLVYLTCPSWALPENGLSWLITPAVNAAMYAGIAAIVSAGVTVLKRAHNRDAVPSVSGADIDRIVARDFTPESRSKVYPLLDQYGGESWHREKDRVRIAVLKLAEGDISKVESYIQLARSDYRDALAAAEYPTSQANQMASKRDRKKSQAHDRQQYQNWLYRK